ncbi:MAG: carboxypeptidase-like regulatory domain-containing protein [Cytophagales bacterium]|nr:carboxypeptidase-like regulatory domain-containing protein [Cytophagales bacterium]
MKRLSRILFLAVGLFGFFNIQAQEVAGAIKDGSGASIPFVHVWYKGTTIGTYSNRDGTFQLTQNASDTLVFSSIGYERRELPVVRISSDQEIVLQEQLIELNTVTATASRLSRKKEMGFKRSAFWSQMYTAFREDYSQKFRIEMGESAKKGFIEAIHFKITETSNELPLVCELYFTAGEEEKMLHAKPLHLLITQEEIKQQSVSLLAHDITCPAKAPLYAYLTFLGYEENGKLKGGSVELKLSGNKTNEPKTFIRRSLDDPWTKNVDFFKEGPLYGNLNIWVNLTHKSLKHLRTGILRRRIVNYQFRSIWLAWRCSV